MTDPSTNGDNGHRDTKTGRFVKGNAGGPGNPNIRQVAKLREGFHSGCSVADVRAIAKKLVTMAKNGNLNAAREVLDRTLGKTAAGADDGDGDSQKLPPIVEIIVANRDEALQFNEIREQLRRQVGRTGLRDASIGLPAPADD